MRRVAILSVLALLAPAALADPPAPDPAGSDATASTDPAGTDAAGTGAALTGSDVAPAPAPAPPTHARLATNPTPHVRQGRHKSDDDDDGRLQKTEDTVAGGKHWRIKTAEGAVHVWIPDGYDRETAGTVVYVHGYWTDADGAWRDHELARQFRASHQNAMFIVPDAPASNDDGVNWPALKDLRHAITRANLHLPDGPVIVMGHSGAFRTIMQWVDHRLVEQIILLDAMYAGESAFDEYIASGKRADEHKLIVVGSSTAQASAGFAKQFKFSVARERMPETASGFTRRERTARLLYIHSQYEHMQIVTSGKVIPVLLHLTPLKAL